MNDITTKNDLYDPKSVEERKNQEDPLIMYIVVRKDLNMSAGKIAAQSAHAAQMALLHFVKMKYVLGHEDNIFSKWLSGSFRKVVLGADDKRWNKLKDFYKNAPEQIFIVQDAGLTEVEPGSETVAAIWPMPKSEAPQVIKKLQTFK